MSRKYKIQLIRSKVQFHQNAIHIHHKLTQQVSLYNRMCIIFLLDYFIDLFLVPRTSIINSLILYTNTRLGISY